VGRLSPLRRGGNMRNAIAFFDRLARPRILLLLLALEVLLLGSVNGFDFPLSVPFMIRTTGCSYLDMCAFCSATQIYDRLQAFGSAGRHLQLLLLTTVDIAIPVTSGLFGVAALISLSRDFRVKWLWFVPIAATVLDLLENTGIASLVLSYPMRLDILAGLTGFISGVKFCAYALTLVLILLLGIVRIVHRISRRLN